MLSRALDEIARLKKNSSNSSKPPSSDIVKPKKDYKKRKPKKRGGQKGRKPCVRAPFPPDQVDTVVEHAYEGLAPARYEPLPGRYTTPGRGTQAKTLGRGVWKQRHGYVRFLEDPGGGIEPTNNPAERELRAVVLHRKVTQGTRGEAGRRR